MNSKVKRGAVALLLAIGLAGCSTPQPGEIGVVRSGKTFWWPGTYGNGHNITGIAAPNTGAKWYGAGSTIHWYPADTVQRNYTITSDPRRGDRPGVDVVEVPTKDGVRVGIEGTIYFTTAFNASPQGEKLVEDFDNRFGVRTFGANALSPWDGQDGFLAFLDTVVRPIIDNDMRQTIATFSCAQLVSSCALASRTQQSLATANNNGNIKAVQDAINTSLQDDIKSTLGEDYFASNGNKGANGIQFRLARVTLPPVIQAQIDNAQAQFAAVGAATAKVQQANQEALANKARQAGYVGCPACAQIDELKAIPPNVTTFAPGAGFAITPHK